MNIIFEISTIALLVVLNGWFAMSELAIVSSRRPRLAAKAAQGSKGAQIALQLADNPARFLSSVQIGITLVGVLAGAYSGATLAEKLALWIAAEFPSLAEMSEALALAAVVGAITFASLIVGELVPKQIALANPERIAVLVSRPMLGVAKIATPLVWTLEASSHGLLRLLRIDRSSRASVTEEEVKAMIAEGAETGVFAPQEQEMFSGVMRLGDRSVRAVMTPRSDVIFIDLSWERDRIIDTLKKCPHSRIPVYRDDPDNILGVVQAKDMLNALLDGNAMDIVSLVKPVEIVSDRTPALRMLDILKRAPIHLVVAVDEHGSVEGIVTAADILSSIVGSLSEHGEDYEGVIFERADGSWLLDGDVAADIAADRIGCQQMRAENDAYTTVAGFFLSHLRHIPTAGEHFTAKGWRFEVVDMDGRRIDKVLISKTDAAL